MKKEIEIKVPTNWSAITLKKYFELKRDLDAYGDEENGHIATLLYHLCGVTPIMITKLPSDVLNSIKVDLASFMGETNLPLKKFITIDGVKYGFEPNLSKMEYGAYLDITKFDTITINENWTKIMSVLYRPVTSSVNGMYSIESYDGYKNEDKFLEVGMDVHFGALSFFFHILTDLLNDILNFSKEEELHPNIKLTLERSGNLIKQLYNLPVTISPSLILSLKGV
jgi:hypothetical protein